MDKQLDEVKNDEGKVLEINGEEIAVYKDENGTIITLSPVCTHMGCTVEWNSKEKTWDCPCHGSKFSKTGSMLQGPAKENLKKVQI